ncbi:hypothetical protein [Nitrospina watsonii]|uniref:Uncharacterized protein n=1 Tax=Nitrospina watsonii TaxID=1323948 RepID=A0ABM9HI44_9BACT|nr:hypothetical protein [Nitrospina watsonii]CAI2719744.1 conserved protein of unknown function [Nitrospina watsonii]
MRDMQSNMDAVNSIAPAAYTASANGSGVDLQGHDATMVVFSSGVADTTDTDEVYTPKVEESDDNVTFTAVAAGDMEGTLANLAANSVQRVGYKGGKRYIRAVLTIAGTTPSVQAAGIVLRGHPAQAPVA